KTKTQLCTVRALARTPAGKSYTKLWQWVFFGSSFSGADLRHGRRTVIRSNHTKKYSTYMMQRELRRPRNATRSDERSLVGVALSALDKNLDKCAYYAAF